MTAFADSAYTWDDLLRTWQELEVPEGWRPELTTEGIRMTPPPGGEHNLIADLVHDVLIRHKPDGHGVFQTQGVGVRVIGGIYVPDLCVAPRSAIPSGSEPVASEEVLLAAEITSKGNARHDRKKKKWAYAHGGIPHYLLIDAYDPEGPAVSLFSTPVEGVYSRTIRVPFGKSLALPEPFDVELETAEFAR